MTDYEELYSAYFNDVYRYLLKLSGDPHAAEEITGETFFKALRSIDSFRGECDVRVWLLRIAKNCYRSYLKKSRKIQSIGDSELQCDPDSSASAAERCEREEEIAKIQTILHDLNEPYKEVFLWRVYGELSFKQIAQIFDKNENWACVTYHRARKMILQRLEESSNENRM